MGPRILDIDILAWDDLVIQSDILTVPHEELQERPFALWPLADVAPLWHFPLEEKTTEKLQQKFPSNGVRDFLVKRLFTLSKLRKRIDTSQLVGL